MTGKLIGTMMVTAAMLLSGPARLGATVFYCYEPARCPFVASCEGDFHDDSGCIVICYVLGSDPGEINPAGSANCHSGG
jgi:hypothetical protein